MNGIKPGTDLSFLIGKELIQVRTGKYHLELCFDQEVSVGVEAQVSLDHAPPVHGVPAGALFLEFIGQVIQQVTILGRGDLELLFDGGRRISLLDSNYAFESFQIKGPGIYIVV